MIREPIGDRRSDPSLGARSATARESQRDARHPRPQVSSRLGVTGVKRRLIGVVARLAADAEWIAALKDQLDGGGWFVTPLWRPHFANKAFALRPLAERIGPTVDEVATPLDMADYPSDSTCNAFDTAQVIRAW